MAVSMAQKFLTHLKQATPYPGPLLQAKFYSFLDDCAADIRHAKEIITSEAQVSRMEILMNELLTTVHRKKIKLSRADPVAPWLKRPSQLLKARTDGNFRRPGTVVGEQHPYARAAAYEGGLWEAVRRYDCRWRTDILHGNPWWDKLEGLMNSAVVAPNASESWWTTHLRPRKANTINHCPSRY